MDTSINIANEFSRFPSGRYPEDGPYNGTTFRERFLLPVIKEHGFAVVELDGTAGYPSSFLEEAFGGLVRLGYPVDLVRKTFKPVAIDARFKRYIEMIDSYLNRAVNTQNVQRSN